MKKREKIQDRIREMTVKPVFSIIISTVNTRAEVLGKSIQSVQNQIYPHWELCIVNDRFSDSTVALLLKEFAKNDSRIKVLIGDEEGDVTEACNSAVKLATGEWIAQLCPDDLLSEHALYWAADAIKNHPEIRLIYSDEDRVTSDGKRLDPYFKCDWNPDLFYSNNYFSRLGLFERGLVNTVGGFRKGFADAHDFDLTLRCIEQVGDEQIHHIPRVLYHWRMQNGSTAKENDVNPNAMVAGVRALNEHFKRLEIDATAEATGNFYRVQYALPKKQPLVTLIIPTRNHLGLIRQCIKSIENKTTYQNYEILVIDNNSDDPEVLAYFDSLASNPRIRVIRDERPFNYSQLNNEGVRQANGDIIGLVNNDIEVISPDWLSEMVSHAIRPDIGAVGARLWYPDGRLQHGGVILGIGGGAAHAHKFLKAKDGGYFGRAKLVQNFSAVTAACLLIRKSIYEEVGGLNEQDLKIAFNDVDFCLKVLKAGYRNLWTPYAELYHHESATRGKDHTPEQRELAEKEVMYLKSQWKDLIRNDPAYSPNLSIYSENFRYARPPRID